MSLLGTEGKYRVVVAIGHSYGTWEQKVYEVQALSHGDANERGEIEAILDFVKNTTEIPCFIHTMDSEFLG